MLLKIAEMESKEVATKRLQNATVSTTSMSTVQPGYDKGMRFASLVVPNTIVDQGPEVFMGSVGKMLHYEQYETEDEARAGFNALVDKWEDWDGTEVNKPEGCRTIIEVVNELVPGLEKKGQTPVDFEQPATGLN